MSKGVFYLSVSLPILELELEGLPPTVNHLYRSRGCVRYKTPECKHYQDYVSNNIRKAWKNKEPFTGKIELLITFKTNDRKRWDIDNRVKALQDCLSMAGVIKDDSQIDVLHIERTLGASKSTRILLKECKK